MTEKYNISGITCSAYASHVEKTVQKSEGVQNTNVNLLSNSMTLKFDERKLSSQYII